MEYQVIVEQQNGLWRAVIPTLADLSTEGASLDEALSKARQAAEAYLAKVVLTTIEVSTPQLQAINPRSPQNWLRSAGTFAGREPVIWQLLDDVYAERKRQREEAENEAGSVDAA
jgi:predicted RNase H-like HicB family nuclease